MVIPDSYSPVPEKRVYELLPADSYEAQVSKLDLKKNVPKYQSSEVEDKYNFEFTITEEGKYKGRKVWWEVKTKVSPGSNGYAPSNLYKIFSVINGVALTDEEAKTVTVESINALEGKSLRLVIQQKLNQAGVLKNKITDVLPSKGTVQEDLDVSDIPF